jgi:hypothetical protein
MAIPIGVGARVDGGICLSRQEVEDRPPAAIDHPEL